MKRGVQSMSRRALGHLFDGRLVLVLREAEVGRRDLDAGPRGAHHGTAAVELPVEQREPDHVRDPHLQRGEQQTGCVVVALDELVHEDHERDLVDEHEQRDEGDRHHAVPPRLLAQPVRVEEAQRHEEGEAGRHEDESLASEDLVRQERVERQRRHQRDDGRPPVLGLGRATRMLRHDLHGRESMDAPIAWACAARRGREPVVLAGGL